MKKVFVVALAVMMVMSLFGCGAKELPKEGELGVTLKSDLVEITLTEFGFAEEGVSIDEEKPDLLCKPIPFPYQLTGNEALDNLTLQLSQSTYVRKTDKKCVVYLEYTVKITSDKIVTQSIMPVIHFNDTDSYSLNAVSGVALADYFNGQYDGVYYTQSGDKWSAMNMFWSPDGEYVCRGVAKIPVEVEQNADAPLTVKFTLPNSDETTEVYTYTIR